MKNASTTIKQRVEGAQRLSYLRNKYCGMRRAEQALSHNSIFNALAAGQQYLGEKGPLLALLSQQLVARNRKEKAVRRTGGPGGRAPFARRATQPAGLRGFSLLAEGQQFK